MEPHSCSSNNLPSVFLLPSAENCFSLCGELFHVSQRWKVMKKSLSAIVTFELKVFEKMHSSVKLAYTIYMKMEFCRKIFLKYYSKNLLHLFFKAVRDVFNTIDCLLSGRNWVPPAYIMCLESLSNLLVMISSSSNFIIYCFISTQFKLFFKKLLGPNSPNY